MPQIPSWSRMEYKFLSQNPWVFHSLYLKEQKVLHHWFFKLIPNIQKVYNEIHEVNLCHLHSKMVALALLQPQCFTSPVYKQKKSHAKLSSFHLLDVTFSSSPLKYWPCCEVRSCALDSWYYVKKRRKRDACYCYEKLRQTNFRKNFGKCSQIGWCKARISTWKTSTLQQSP